MDTAIGVFASRDRAEQAVRELRQKGVPEASINYLTTSETDAKTIGKEFGTYVGGFVGGAAGMTAGVVAATLLLPGIGTVFALGFGAAALVGAAGAGAGRAVGSAATQDNEAPVPTKQEKVTEEAAFLREVLNERRSVIVVQTESPETAKLACEVLDRLGLGVRGTAPARMQATTRHVGEVAVLNITGRITLGEGSVALREIVRELADNGHTMVVLNLTEVQYIDSSGMGELVRAHTTLRNRNGRLKLTSLSERVRELLDVTKLSSVFDIHSDEQKAIAAFGGSPSSQAVA